jgi:hypothetical protein
MEKRHYEILEERHKELLKLEDMKIEKGGWKEYARKEGVTIHSMKREGYNCVRGEGVMPFNIKTIVD